MKMKNYSFRLGKPPESAQIELDEAHLVVGKKAGAFLYAVKEIHAHCSIWRGNAKEVQAKQINLNFFYEKIQLKIF